MKFITNITDIKGGKEIIRGHELSDLVKESGFTNTIFLLLKGEMPSYAESKIFDAILTSVVDHGPGVASALNARISASAKNPLHTSAAAGLLGLGERHGAVISQAMEFFYKNIDAEDMVTLLKGQKERKEHILGYGHKIFTDSDPRTETLIEIAKENGFFGKHCEFALKVEDSLNSISSKKLPLNVDGFIAALLCDMDFDSSTGNGIFVIGRIPGLVAHIVEEIGSTEGIRRVTQEEIEYKGN